MGISLGGGKASTHAFTLIVGKRPGQQDRQGALGFGLYPDRHVGRARRQAEIELEQNGIACHAP